MKEKIKCKDCEYCQAYRSLSSTRNGFYCKHPNHAYIFDYFQKRRMCKAPGFLGFGKPYSEEIPIKTSPAWCPYKNKEGDKE